MAITTVLFDLDGTLLPMEQDHFVHTYLNQLIQSASSWGYDPQKLTGTVFQCIQAMVANAGSKSNEDIFWQVFTDAYGPEARKDEARFAQFYRDEFQEVRFACGFQPLARTLIDRLKAQGKNLILATNPLFPQIATHSRIRWAGLAPEDFSLVTTYENSRRCKPSLDYYREILNSLGLDPRECIMVGNDVEEDMIAAQLGMEVFLITDCLISRHGRDLNEFRHGSFQALVDYLA